MTGFDLLEGGWPDVQPQLALPKRSTTVKIIEELENRKKWTPDFRELRLRENILVFMYDEFKRKGLQHGVLKESKFMGEGRTTNNHFYMKNNSNFPVVFSHKGTPAEPNRGFIRGEVFAVPPETLLRLDKLKSNKVMFQRVDRHVTLMDQEYSTKSGKKKPTIVCYMYIGNSAFWKEEDLRTHPTMLPQAQAAKRYYEYTPKIKSIWLESDYYHRQMHQHKREDWTH